MNLNSETNEILNGLNKLLPEYFATMGKNDHYESREFDKFRLFYTKDRQQTASFSLTDKTDKHKEINMGWMRYRDDKWKLEDLVYKDERLEVIWFDFLTRLYNELAVKTRRNKINWNIKIQTLMDKIDVKPTEKIQHTEVEILRSEIIDLKSQILTLISEMNSKKEVDYNREFIGVK